MIDLLTLIVAVLGMALVTLAVWRMVVAVNALHMLINSRMDEWKRAEKAISRYEGHEEGVAKERIDERTRRKQVIAEADRKGEI